MENIAYISEKQATVTRIYHLSCLAFVLPKCSTERGFFQSQIKKEASLKMLYLAMMDITKKWTGRRQDWSLIHAQMAIYFAERMPE